MPYFIFNVYSDTRRDLVEQFSAYREARARVRTLRADLPAAADHTIRMIFAKDADQAEALLSEKREARPLGEDA